MDDYARAAEDFCRVAETFDAERFEAERPSKDPDTLSVEIQALTFTVRWGQRYDPEMMLEHAVCHLLRHRRQLERW